MEDSSDRRDPYVEAVRESEDRSKWPEFLGGEDDGWSDGAKYRLNGDYYDGSGKKIRRRADKGREAARDLSSAEKGAEGDGMGETEDSLSGVRDDEANAKGFYSGSERGVGENKKGSKRGVKGFLKKTAPIGLIFGGFIGSIVAISAGQNLLPIAVKELIVEKLNSVGVSSTVASDEWLDTQLNQGVRKEALKTGQVEGQFAFSEYQVQQLRQHGIEVVDGSNGGITALLYEKNGEYIPVVGSDVLSGYDTNTIISTIRSDSGYANIGTPVSAESALVDSSFKIPYTKASKGWRGGISGWFDNIMSDITETKLGITRGRWARYAAGSLKETAKEFKKIADDGSGSIAKSRDYGVENDGKTVYEDSDGNLYTDVAEDADTGKFYVENSAEQKVEVEVSDVGDVDVGETEMPKLGYLAEGIADNETFQKINGILNSKAMSVATRAADIGCSIIEGMMTIYAVASAYQSLQTLNLISGFLESVDKVKAGDGEGSPIHQYGTNLTVASDTIDGSTGEVAKENKTAVSSAGMAHLFLGVAMGQGDASVQNLNFETMMSRLSALTSDIADVAISYEVCGYVKIAGAAVSLASTVFAVASFGITKVIQEVGKGIAKGIAKGVIIMVFKMLIPIAAKKIGLLIAKNAATEWFGEDLGNAIYSGASKYLGGNGTSGGQSPASEDKIMQYLSQRNMVIAEEAEYQRATRSPFDVTSPYTFLGSLVYSAMPLAYSGGVMSSLMSFSNMAMSSFVTLMPTANAAEISDELESRGSCVLMESTGAVGDAFCNPYIITDSSTITTSPVAVSSMVHSIGDDRIASVDSTVARLDNGNNFDDDGKIKKDSNLAKYITYCGQRTSPYGIRDASIAEQTLGENTTVKTIMGVVPVLGDIQQMVEGGKEVYNFEWVTGERCVAAEDSSWENEYKWYQRYAENERLVESMNPGYVSTVTAYLNDYYKENPIDQSFDGTLARFSGRSKEEVDDVLAIILYEDMLENYHPEERYAFGKPEVEIEKELKFDNGNTVAENLWTILLNQISYADVRNRSFAV